MALNVALAFSTAVLGDPNKLRLRPCPGFKALWGTRMTRLVDRRRGPKRPQYLRAIGLASATDGIAVVAAAEKRRVALLVHYIGTGFRGWEAKPGIRTVQGVLEAAIARSFGSIVADNAVCVAGRTDAGVHALGQVAHYDRSTAAERQVPAVRWAKILNTHLPEDVVILASASAPSPFWHARFSATFRRYRYSIFNGRRPNLFVAQTAWHRYQVPLDPHQMQAALSHIVGTPSSMQAFHKVRADGKGALVTVEEACCYRRGPMVYVEVQADRFLHGMMRLLVAQLVQVGEGTTSVEDFTAVWHRQARESVKFGAPACGLCLTNVGYAEVLFDASKNDNDLIYTPGGSPLATESPRGSSACA